MSDEFLRVARQEIQAELDGLKQIIARCNNDEHIFKNSKYIEKHIHKIKGLAPMMRQEMVGDIAKILDVIMRHVLEHGVLAGSYQFIVDTVVIINNLFNGQKMNVLNDVTKKAHKTFPQISNW